jgi:hypothetical protein
MPFQPFDLTPYMLDFSMLGDLPETMRKSQQQQIQLQNLPESLKTANDLKKAQTGELKQRSGLRQKEYDLSNAKFEQLLRDYERKNNPQVKAQYIKDFYNAIKGIGSSGQDAPQNVPQNVPQQGEGNPLSQMLQQVLPQYLQQGQQEQQGSQMGLADQLMQQMPQQGGQQAPIQQALQQQQAPQQGQGQPQGGQDDIFNEDFLKALVRKEAGGPLVTEREKSDLQEGRETRLQEKRFGQEEKMQQERFDNEKSKLDKQAQIDMDKQRFLADKKAEEARRAIDETAQKELDKLDISDFKGLEKDISGVEETLDKIQMAKQIMKSDDVRLAFGKGPEFLKEFLENPKYAQLKPIFTNFIGQQAKEMSTRGLAFALQKAAEAKPDIGDRYAIAFNKLLGMEKNLILTMNHAKKRKGQIETRLPKFRGKRVTKESTWNPEKGGFDDA